MLVLLLKASQKQYSTLKNIPLATTGRGCKRKITLHGINKSGLWKEQISNN